VPHQLERRKKSMFKERLNYWADEVQYYMHHIAQYFFGSPMPRPAMAKCCCSCSDGECSAPFGPPFSCGDAD